MKELIVTNTKESNLNDLLTHFSDKADSIKVVSAFFSDIQFITDWLNESKQIDLLISLRPPTNYYSLKEVFSKSGININFLGRKLHSKFFIFYLKNVPFASIIGSSNFTSGGLIGNIETNAVLSEPRYLTEMDRHFTNIWEQSFLLQPSDLDAFKKVFDNFQKRKKEIDAEQEDFENKLLTRRTKGKGKIKVGKEAKQYFLFWRVVDSIKEMVKNISAIEYPGVPVYISIDHFWHWIVTVWGKEGRPAPTPGNRNLTIPKLFQEFSKWDKKNGDFTVQMAKKSKNLFGNLLSERNIDRLSKEGAREIYANLHSGAMRTRRFGADEDFITQNSIERIRSSLKYLLYSNDELDLRIHQLCEPKSPLKLKQLKSSGSQELIGWVNPNKYPIRNDKADKALKLLGIDIEGY